MNTLVMALYTEGSTDERFLSPIIQRTAETILAERSQQVVDVLQPICFNDNKIGSRAERIFQVAQQAAGYHLLIIHADADAGSADTALKERIYPGLQLIQTAAEEIKLPQEIVPIVPVHMTEAWMLADLEALQDVIGVTLSHQQLDLPMRAKLVEEVANPKSKLEQLYQQIMRSSSRRSRRRYNIGELYAPLGEQISLKALDQVPAYQRFASDLERALNRIGFI